MPVVHVSDVVLLAHIFTTFLARVMMLCNTVLKQCYYSGQPFVHRFADYLTDKTPHSPLQACVPAKVYSLLIRKLAQEAAPSHRAKPCEWVGQTTPASLHSIQYFGVIMLLHRKFYYRSNGNSYLNFCATKTFADYRFSLFLWFFIFIFKDAWVTNITLLYCTNKCHVLSPVPCCHI